MVMPGKLVEPEEMAKRSWLALSEFGLQLIQTQPALRALIIHPSRHFLSVLRHLSIAQTHQIADQLALTGGVQKCGFMH